TCPARSCASTSHRRRSPPPRDVCSTTSASTSSTSRPSSASSKRTASSSIGPTPSRARVPRLPSSPIRGAHISRSTSAPTRRTSIEFLVNQHTLLSSPRKRGPSIPEHVLRCWSVSAVSVITWSPLARGRHRAGGLLPSPEQLPENLLGALGQFHQL